MTIKIYSTPSCVFCKQAKEFFKLAALEYEEVNVAENQEAREEMVKKSGQMGVPVIDIDGAILVGYNPKDLKKVLGFPD